MSANHSQFVAIAAEFLLDHLAPRLRGRLASDTRADAGSVAMSACISAWLDDLQGGRVEAALEPTRLARALESLWKWGIVCVLTPPGQVDPEYVDIAVKPEDVAVLDLAVAAVTALDTLRGTAVAAAFRCAQRKMIEEFAIMLGAQAGVHGAA